MSTDRGRTDDTVGDTNALWRGRNTGGTYCAAGPDPWYRYNRSIRFYGLTFLVGTKLADIVTTVVGMRYIPSIVEANPVANRLFTEMGLVTGLTVLGFATVLFAACAAELFGVEVRRRYGLPKTALFAQASIYLILSVLFGLVALHNATLIADQTTYMLDGMLAPAAVIGG
ncbi:DUF5658 family protein [Natronomonas salsuginis]|uniref:DUF5658 domain-containing protein n=1 Tax=Natronomonas salsuginis TaxID=2217661 RepID=A0A4U5JCK4_9EURY|nr:DUF5658 family protein [Natronomonas salsuginis]TKR25317.1 hypothetical protein DM868_11165 [Natronomonas salsuginis]